MTLAYFVNKAKFVCVEVCGYVNFLNCLKGGFF